MPEKILTWENEFTSDRWDLKVDGELFGYYEPAQKPRRFSVFDKHGQCLIADASEAEARSSLSRYAVQNG